MIHFRCAEPPTANLNKYRDELLDAYLFVEDADALYAEYAAKGVEFTREVANMPWHSREFVVKDCLLYTSGIQDFSERHPDDSSQLYRRRRRESPNYSRSGSR